MDDRDLAIADDDVADTGWRQALLQPSQFPAVADQDDSVEDFGRAGEQPHGSVTNIPTDPQDYIADLPVVPGHTWTRDDLPNLQSFADVAHQADLTVAQVDLLLRWYASGVVSADDDDDDAPETPDAYQLIQGHWTKYRPFGRNAGDVVLQTL